jgi:probable addiction module antidote protein
MPTKDVFETFGADLRDPEFIALALQQALEDDDPAVFLITLRDAARANGMGKLAEDIPMARTSLYKALSDKGNPEYRTLRAILGQLGLRLSVVPAENTLATAA